MGGPGVYGSTPGFPPNVGGFGGPGYRGFWLKT
jgi:hypothetical protein